MKRAKSWLFNIVIIVLLLVGLGLIFNRNIRNMMIAGNTNKYQVSNYTAQQLAKNKTTASSSANYDFSKITPVNFNSVLGSQASNQNLPVVGGIAIPSLNINLPIIMGVSDVALEIGAGTMKATDTMGEGNYSLASHHIIPGYFADGEKMLFSPLDKAVVGMDVYLTDKTTIYVYRIDSIKFVEPSDVSVINDVDGRKMLTLVTCNDSGSMREIVQGDLTTTYPFSQATSKLQKAFNEKYNQMPLS
ncbi:MAG: class A sortase [Streptococcaceae bacterium]|jgi:sortase A|nr:class A sortase [Streptococcaceae bacterium]